MLLCWKIQGLRRSDASHSLWPTVLGCEMHQTPSALGFPTQQPSSIFIPIPMYQPCPVTVPLYLQSGVHNELQTDILQSLISWKSSNVCKAIIHEIEAEQQGFSEMYGRIGPQYETDQPSGSRTKCHQSSSPLRF